MPRPIPTTKPDRQTISLGGQIPFSTSMEALSPSKKSSGASWKRYFLSVFKKIKSQLNVHENKSAKISSVGNNKTNNEKSHKQVRPHKSLKMLQAIPTHTNPANFTNHNCSITQLQKVRRLHYCAAINTILTCANRNLLADDHNAWSLHAALLNDLEILEHDTKQHAQHTVYKNDIKVTKTLNIRLIKKLQEFLPVSKEEIHSIYQQKLIDQVNQIKWKTIHNKIQLDINNHVDSELIPAGQMRLFKKKTGRDLFPVSYNEQGISSKTTNCVDHMVNGWACKLKNKQGHTQFIGIRHGVHSAFGVIDDPEKKQSARLNRAKESILAAIWNRSPHDIEYAIKNTEHIIDIDLTSNSLLTPSAIPTNQFNEGEMLLDQVLALRELSCNHKTCANQPDFIEIPVTNSMGKTHLIKVRARILTFNFGVNSLALHPILSKATGGWSAVHEMNKIELQTLLGSTQLKDLFGGWVGQRLMELDELEIILYQDNLEPDIRLQIEEALKKRKIIKILAQQIREIWHNKSYKREEGEAYKMTSRLALLTFLLGGVPLFNCKSGKDRTGFLYAEILFLLIKSQSGAIPKPGQPLTNEDSQLLFKIQQNCGNLEVQEYCTGVAGYKVDPLLKSIKQRLARKEAYQATRGLSEAV